MYLRYKSNKFKQNKFWPPLKKKTITLRIFMQATNVTYQVYVEAHKRS